MISHLTPIRSTQAAASRLPIAAVTVETRVAIAAWTKSWPKITDEIDGR